MAFSSILGFLYHALNNIGCEPMLATFIIESVFWLTVIDLGRYFIFKDILHGNCVTRLAQRIEGIYSERAPNLVGLEGHVQEGLIIFNHVFKTVVEFLLSCAVTNLMVSIIYLYLCH